MIDYIKIGAVAIVAAALVVGMMLVQHWRSEAARVPALEEEIAMLRGQMDSTNFSLEQCIEEVNNQNTLVEAYLAKACDVERELAAAKQRATQIDREWRQRWAGLPPPPPDCCGAMVWLGNNAPGGWNVD